MAQKQRKKISEDKIARPLVRVENIGKSFGATRALENVSFEFFPGEIFAMVGANGAGKSTLIKIICGYHPDYDGKIFVDEKEVNFTTPRDAYQCGIQTVHQIINQGVIQNMTVAENLALADMLSPDQPLFYREERVNKRAEQIAHLMDIEYLDLNMEVEKLPQSDRQMLTIARAVAANPKLLILDEPTSSISEKETERLFRILDRLKKTGVAILYVSHRLHEIEKIADRVGVIRDGVVGGLIDRPFKVKQIVTAMVGEVTSHRDGLTEKKFRDQPIQLELRELRVQKHTPPVNLKVKKGEILGITGLIGAGKSELAQVLFGMEKPFSGEILIEGKKIISNNISDAIKNGIFMVPEDRNNNAVIPETSVMGNITIPFLKSFSKFSIMKSGLESLESRRMVNSMRIKCENEATLIENLSGGNQQKVIVARWLLKKYKVLILDEPFQGVDISSRHEIIRYLSRNSDGKAIIILASDLDEILEAADRIVVLNHGQIVGEQLYESHNKKDLVHLISQSIQEISQER